MKAYINSFESFGTKDGPGIRFVLFLQGCSLRCIYCHNVDTWDLRKKNYVYNADEIMKEINKISSFLTGGVTVSGGEPLMQANFVLELFKKCKENKLHTAVDTSGYIFNKRVKEVLGYTDLVLLDLKHIDKNKYKDITSVDIDNTLKFLDYLEEIDKKTWIRYVLIPGYTDEEKDLHRWAEYISKFTTVKRVDILPFHQMGIYKWEKVNMKYKLGEIDPPSKENIKKAENIFKIYGLSLYKERE